MNVHKSICGNEIDTLHILPFSNEVLLPEQAAEEHCCKESIPCKQNSPPAEESVEMESDVQETIWFLNHLNERYPPVKGIPSFSQGSEYDVLANIAKYTQQSDSITMICYNIRSMTANMDWFVKTLFGV